MTLQNNLYLIHEWSLHWQLKFIFIPLHQFGSYYLNDIMIDIVESWKHIGILWSSNYLLGLIMRSFDHFDSDMLIKLFVTMVNPILEYCNSVGESRPLFVLLQFSRGVPTIICSWSKEKSSGELQYYHQLETSLTGRDSWYWSYHLSPGFII